MKTHFIILAHKDPGQVGRLVRRLISADSHFYIHIDKDVKVEPFIKAMPEDIDIHFMSEAERVSIAWGDIGDVIATLNVLKVVCAKHTNGYCILLSGQDYPLKSIDEIRHFLAKNNGREFINIFSLPTNRWEQNGRDRLNRYRISFAKERGNHLLLPSIFNQAFYTRQNFKDLQKVIGSSQRKILLELFKMRRFPSYLRPYGGSQWWMLTINTVLQVLNFTDLNPGYVKYHQYTLLPDEIFFHSIIMEINKNTPERIQETLTYVNWHKKNVALPAILMMEDLPELTRLPDTVLFARKFDQNVCPKILDTIDEMIDNRVTNIDLHVNQFL